MKTTGFKIFIFVLLFICPAHSQTLQFFRETIDIDVGERAAVVSGTYFFKNPGHQNIHVPLYYPFVVNDSLPMPDSVAVFDLIQKKELPVTPVPQGVRFYIYLPAKSIRIYRVVYRQATPYHMMEYILTTTKKWGRALQSAEYTVTLPQNYTLRDSSLPFRRKSLDTPGTFYYYKINNFLPHKNFHIRWRKQTK